MKKIQYIAPAIKTVEIGTADGILITGSNESSSLLGNGGSTEGEVIADTKEDRSTPSYNVWDDDWSK